MYDLMVIGDDISSYVAASLGVKYGLNTVHIAENNIQNMFIGDIPFNADLSPITGFEDGQIANALLKELNIDFLDISGSLNPAYQIILPDHRLDFFSDKDSLIKEFIREFPDKEKEITKYYDKLEKYSLFLKKWLSDHPFFQINGLKQYFHYFKLFINLIKFKLSKKKFNKILFSNSSLRKIYESQLALLSSDIDNFQFFSSAYHLYSPVRGIYQLPKGKNDFLETLLGFFINNGGKYFQNLNLLEIKKGNLIEAEIMDEKETISKIEAKYLIISNKADGLKLFYRKKKKVKTYKWLKNAKITHYPFTLHFILPARSLPEKMSQHVALLTDIDKDIYDNNLIVLQINTPDIEKRTNQGKVILTATVFLPSDDNTWRHENLMSTADSIINRMEQFLPFMKDNIKLYEVNKSIDYSLQYRNISNPKYRVKKSYFSGFTKPQNKTSIKNVYLAGTSLFTDIGWEGEIISGMYALYSVLKKENSNGV